MHEVETVSQPAQWTGLLNTAVANGDIRVASEGRIAKAGDRNKARAGGL